jgi:hypothetical protein
LRVQGVIEGEVSNTDVSPVTITPLTANANEMVNANPVNPEVVPQPPLMNEK